MFRLITLSYSLFLLFNSSVFSQNTINLKFTDAKMVYNNHVGNEWRFGTILGEYILGRGGNITISYNDTLEIVVLKAVIEEGNETHDDRNEEEYTFSISELLQYIGNGFYIEIELQEQHGRYAGNKALWRYYYEVSQED